MKKRFIVLLALLLLLSAALAEPVQYSEIIALREKIALMQDELAEKESALAEMQRLYRIQNANRRIEFGQETWTLFNGNNVRLDPDVVRVKDDAPARTELRWESSDPSVVWIDRETGRAYAKATGVAEITCWALDDADVSGRISMQVIEPIDSIRLSAGSVLLTVRGSGEQLEKSTYRLEATIKPDNAFDKRLTWTSDDESIVRVLGEGLLRAEGVGQTTVTATANDGSGKRATVTVKVVKGVEYLSLSHTEAMVTAGKKLRLNATILPKDAGEQKLVWQSSDEAVATVTTKGVVYAEKPGVCTITATTTDGTAIVAECVVTVVK